MTQGFDHKSDFEQGREDALNGFPRASTRAYYRAGYDRGLSQKTADLARYGHVAAWRWREDA